MRGRRLGKIAAGAMVAALGVGTVAALGPVPGTASSHREAPLISADPQADNTDVYAFRSPDRRKTITLISTWIPFEEPAGGPNFYAFAEEVNYDIKVDNDGDAEPERVYRFEFTNHYRSGDTFLYNTGVVDSLDDKDLNFFQTYDLTMIRPGRDSDRLVNDATVVPSRVGDVSMPDYDALRDEGVRSFDMGGRSFAGQGDDPFFLDLRVFDLLYGTDLSLVGDDTLAGFNVNAIAVQVRRSQLAKGGDIDANPVIGVWSTASRPSTRIQKDNGNQSFSGENVQVSRLGMPLVNEVVIPVGDKDRWNGSKPKDDGQFLSYVNDPELARLIDAIYSIPAPDSDMGEPGIQRDDLIEVFLTGIDGLNEPAGVTPSEQLRLNMTTPVCESGSCAEYSRLGVIDGDVAGYPNGRRLADDTIDISLQVVEGILLGQDTGLGDDVDANDLSFGGSFPYLALPHSGSDPSPH